MLVKLIIIACLAANPNQCSVVDIFPEMPLKACTGPIGMVMIAGYLDTHPDIQDSVKWECVIPGPRI